MPTEGMGSHVTHFHLYNTGERYAVMARYRPTCKSLCAILRQPYPLTITAHYHICAPNGITIKTNRAVLPKTRRA